MAKIGVVLSGCGVNDGSEIHEAVITMLELDKAGAEMILMAPNIDLQILHGMLKMYITAIVNCFHGNIPRCLVIY